jgi:hypothetical protein
LEGHRSSFHHHFRDLEEFFDIVLKFNVVILSRNYDPPETNNDFANALRSFLKCKLYLLGKVIICFYSVLKE